MVEMKMVALIKALLLAARLQTTTTSNFMQRIESFLTQTLLGVPLYLWIIGILVLALVLGGGRSGLLAKLRRY